MLKRTLNTDCNHFNAGNRITIGVIRKTNSGRSFTLCRSMPEFAEYYADFFCKLLKAVIDLFSCITLKRLFQDYLFGPGGFIAQKLQQVHPFFKMA